MGIKQKKEYTVKIRAYRTKSIPFKTEKIDDDSLYEGEEVVKQRGTNGCKAVCYRDLYLKGKKISSELLSTDTYSAMKRILKVGTKKKKEKPKVNETNEITNSVDESQDPTNSVE